MNQKTIIYNAGKSFLKKEEVKKVFILRPDNLGDVVLFTGALRHIKEYYSNANIVICVKKYTRNLLEKCPYIDKIISWEDLTEPLPHWLPRFKRRSYIEKIVWFFVWFLVLERSIKKKYECDLFLLPVCSTTLRMHLFARAIQAKAKYGISGDTSNQTYRQDRRAENIYSDRLELPRELKNQHELNINCLFLNFIGINTKVEDLWPVFWTDTYDRRWAFINVKQTKDSIVLAICPGVGSKAQKKYPAIRYADAISELKEVKMSVILFGSAGEKDQCDKVGKAVAKCENVNSILNLAGQSSIRKLIEGLKRCDLVISNDTAALQIAVALKKPTVGIIGGEHFGRFYPWGDAKINRLAHKEMDCYWCNGKCIYFNMKCVQDIEPENIACQIENLLWRIKK